MTHKEMLLTIIRNNGNCKDIGIHQCWGDEKPVCPLSNYCSAEKNISRAHKEHPASKTKACLMYAQAYNQDDILDFLL